VRATPVTFSFNEQADPLVWSLGYGDDVVEWTASAPSCGKAILELVGHENMALFRAPHDSLPQLGHRAPDGIEENEVRSAILDLCPYRLDTPPDLSRVARILEINHPRHGNPCVRPVDIQPTHLPGRDQLSR